MDEAAGCLVPVAIGLFVLAVILVALAWIFITLAWIFGHPLVVVLIFTALGAVGGLLRHERRSGVAAAVAQEDYATIGSLQLLPAQWAKLVLIGFAGLIGLYGMVFL